MVPKQLERLTADERREEVVQAAMQEFAIGGLHGTSTQAIAKRVGVSQPYLFQLFETKKKLFIATVERGFSTIRERFHTAAKEATSTEEILVAMKVAYMELLQDRTQLLLQMQAYAASHDPEVREVVRNEYGRLYRYIEALSGADPLVLQRFFAYGMLMNVAAALDLSELEADWVKSCFNMGVDVLDLGPADALDLAVRN